MGEAAGDSVVPGEKLGVALEDMLRRDVPVGPPAQGVAVGLAHGVGVALANALLLAREEGVELVLAVVAAEAVGLSVLAAVAVLKRPREEEGDSVVVMLEEVLGVPLILPQPPVAVAQEVGDSVVVRLDVTLALADGVELREGAVVREAVAEGVKELLAVSPQLGLGVVLGEMRVDGDADWLGDGELEAQKDELGLVLGDTLRLLRAAVPLGVEEEVTPPVAVTALGEKVGCCPVGETEVEALKTRDWVRAAVALTLPVEEGETPGVLVRRGEEEVD